MTNWMQQQSGGEKTIETLVQDYGPALKRFFQRRILEHADVDDLVQEVFLRLTRRGDLQGVSNLDGYIFQTAANILKDRLRKRFTHHSNEHVPIEDSEAGDTDFSPERVLLGKEALGKLRAALLALPGRTRDVFILARIEGMPNAEVAKKLGISLSAVNQHMARAMESLLVNMKDEF